jgi:hypothetical protein
MTVTAAPGLKGTLEFCTRPDHGQRIMHRGHALLLRAANGVFVFLDVETRMEVCLYADEIVEFVSRPEP